MRALNGTAAMDGIEWHSSNGSLAHKSKEANGFLVLLLAFDNQITCELRSPSAERAPSIRSSERLRCTGAFLVLGAAIS